MKSQRCREFVGGAGMFFPPTEGGARRRHAEATREYRADELFRGFPLDAGTKDIAFDLHLTLKGALPGARLDSAEDEFLAVGDDGDRFAAGCFFLHPGKIALELAGIYCHV